MTLQSRAEKFVSEAVPRDVTLESLKPNFRQRNPVYQSWLYPIFGIHRLGTDMAVAKPILYSTFVALFQSGIITAGYVYISFKYVYWFVTKHLLNFSYFNLRPLFGVIQYVSGQNLTTTQMEWATAALLTLFQAAVLSNSLIGYRIRAQGKRAGEAVLSSKPRNKHVPVQTRESQERRQSGGFVWRLAKNSLWNTFIIPIYTFPVVGQVLYAYLRAPAITSSYLALFQSSVARDHKYGAIGFGVVAGLLSALPFVGHIFSITNAVGAALWIQDLEQEDSPAALAKDSAAQR